MIVEMQKVTVLVSARDREAALERLRDLGMVHVHAVRTPSSESMQALEAQMGGVDRALQLIGAEGSGQEGGDAAGAAGAVEAVLQLGQQRDALRRELGEHQANDRWFTEWGPVSLASVEQVRQAGIGVRFYVTDAKAGKNLPEDQLIEVIESEAEDGAVRLVQFGEGIPPRLELREDPMPQVEVGPMRARMEEIEARLAEAETTLAGHAGAAPRLAAHREELAGSLEFQTVNAGMGTADRIAYVQGFCPTEDAEAIVQAAQEMGWGYVIEEPDEPAVVPTLIRTPAWVRIVNPVFSFMGTVPGYKEYDIGFFFLVFFSLFYAMLVGDGGYGLVFLAATAFARRKLPEAPREPFALMYVLSLATIAWGTISGTWFGMQSVYEAESLSFLKDLSIGPLRSVGGDATFMMFLCFLIGSVQLTIAHGLIGLRNIRSPMALAQLGWIGIIWSLFFLAGNLVLRKPFPGFFVPLAATGFGLVLLFANFQKNVIKGILVTLGDLPLSAISSFSDVVSYLRLFAVGFATFVVASSFNTMAAGVGSGIVGGLAAAIILFLGHGLNIILAMMAVVVHGIRLNMLEFSGHLNMQWSGKPYRPFRASQEA